ESFCDHLSCPRLSQAAAVGVCRRVALASVKPKKTRRREQPRGGVLWVRGGRRVTIHRADLRHAFIKGSGCRYDSRLWKPEIALTPLQAGPAGPPRRTARPARLDKPLPPRPPRNEQTTWRPPPPAPPRSPLCARPCATAASRRRRGWWRTLSPTGGSSS